MYFVHDCVSDQRLRNDIISFLNLVNGSDPLSFYGVRGVANAWLEDYPMNRKQYVFVDNQASSMQFIKCCVPQGSVLGPVLFLLFINDICNVSNLLKFFLFADDTNIFCSNENVEVLQDTLNRELAKLFVWFSINKLSLNLGKTNYMLFQSRPPDLELHLKIINADIPKVTATKFLGIIIDDRLKGALYRIQILCRRYTFWSYPAGLTIADPPG